VPASASWILALLLILAPAARSAAPKPKTPSAANLQAQVKKLTAERDELKERLGAMESFQQDLAEAKKSRDLARQETQACQKELEQMRASFNENQSSGDAILKELQKAKADAAALLADNEKARKELAALAAKPKSGVDEGALVPISPEIVPARPINLNRVTPRTKKVDRGVVVVNVLVSENGEVLATRLLQGLPGKSEWIDKANEACVEAAKRLVFDPATASDGKTKVRVWQGVGFLID
jgi:hypothetical protein